MSWKMTILAMAFCVVGYAVGPSQAKPVVLVENGVAQAVIVVPEQAEKSVTEAAEACRKIVEQITGVQLTVQTEKQYRGSDLTVILVGQSKLAKKLGVDIRQDVNGPEHYLIRTIERGPRQYLALVGNDKWEYNRGSAFAVYDLFWRLGCSWYGPDELWQIIPKRKTLTVPSIDDFQSPAFLSRSLWLHGPVGVIKDAWRLGGRNIVIQHTLTKLVPSQKYPQYYGTEEPEDQGGLPNPSITHPEVIKIIAESLRKRIDTSKAPPGYRETLSVTPEDGRPFYHHPDAPQVGNLSAQLMYMTNGVARELQKTHPNRFLLCNLTAYYRSYSPPQPMIKAEPGIFLMQVNEGNHTKPLEYPILHERRHPGRSNQRVMRSFRGWEKTGALHGIYEWWLPGHGGGVWGKLPWFSMYTASQNLQFWHRRGIKDMLYEAHMEYIEDWFSLRWPTYYVAARCMWDPKPTHEEIMTEACRQLYGPAASEMWQYYNTVEKAMLDSPEPCGNWVFPGEPTRVFTPDYEVLIDKHMQKAVELARKDSDPAVAARVANQQQHWARAKQIVAKDRVTDRWWWRH